MRLFLEPPPTATETPAVVRATVRFLFRLSSSEMGVHSSLRLTSPLHSNGFTPKWNSTFFSSLIVPCNSAPSTNTPGSGNENRLQCCATWRSSSVSPAFSTATKNMPFFCSCDFASRTTVAPTWMLQQ